MGAACEAPELLSAPLTLETLVCVQLDVLRLPALLLRLTHFACRSPCAFFAQVLQLLVANLAHNPLVREYLTVLEQPDATSAVSYVGTSAIHAILAPAASRNPNVVACLADGVDESLGIAAPPMPTTGRTLSRSPTYRLGRLMARSALAAREQPLEVNAEGVSVGGGMVVQLEAWQPGPSAVRGAGATVEQGAEALGGSGEAVLPPRGTRRRRQSPPPQDELADAFTEEEISRMQAHEAGELSDSSGDERERAAWAAGNAVDPAAPDSGSDDGSDDGSGAAHGG